ncbi:MAG: methionyl-tRNA formyltransferase, partial [Sphingomonadales bacterium]|nr:methionyl-tRNA formyltransferase [Sphingomonadales bacterium]
MGTPDFSLPTLKSLIESKHEVAVVYTQPPRPAGRGKKLQKSPIHKLAEQHGIEVRTPTSLKSEAEQQAFAELNLDICIVVAYGLILPKAILD